MFLETQHVINQSRRQIIYRRSPSLRTIIVQTRENVNCTTLIPGASLPSARSFPCQPPCLLVETSGWLRDVTGMLLGHSAAQDYKVWSCSANGHSWCSAGHAVPVLTANDVTLQSDLSLVLRGSASKMNSSRALYRSTGNMG